MAATGALGITSARVKPRQTPRASTGTTKLQPRLRLRLNVRVAVHPLGPQEPPYPPSYDEEGERNALRLLAESAYINLPSGQHNRYAFPSQSANELLAGPPALIYQDDNES